jgi:hypothetical protein
VIAALDLARSTLLKETLKVSFLNHLFRSRAHRILSLGLLALTFYFFVSQFFPLWVLLVGPIIWGVPHIISSLRYNSLSFPIEKKNLFYKVQTLAWLLVFAYRLSIDVYEISLPLEQYPFAFELIAMSVSFVLQICIQKELNMKVLLGFFAFSSLVIATHFYPVYVSLILLIGHNYLPLINWWASCQTKADRQVFIIFSITFITLSLSILFGLIDPLFHYLSPVANIGFLHWDYSDIVTAIGGDINDYKFWYHVVCLYAFSQAVHYFMWLKAIPENYQPSQHPPSFRWSFNRLNSDFGSASIFVFLILILLGSAYWLFIEFHTARIIYFCIASYHGFMEISAIPFIKKIRP